MKSSKGIFSFDLIAFMPRFIFMIFVVLAVVLVVNQGVTQELQTKSLQGELFIETLLNSPSGLALIDDQGNTVIGHVDITKIDKEHLEKSFLPQDISAKIELLGKTQGVEKTIFYNEVDYNRFAPLSGKKLSGKGTSEKVERWSKVFINQELRIIHFEVIVPFD